MMYDQHVLDWMSYLEDLVLRSHHMIFDDSGKLIGFYYISDEVTYDGS